MPTFAQEETRLKLVTGFMKAAGVKCRKANGLYIIVNPKTGVQFQDHSPATAKQRMQTFLRPPR